MAINHYTLTQKQLIILKLLYRFRFISSDLLSKSTGINQNTINKRLTLLMEQGYIGRNYDPEYHLLRKPASYYLLPPGIKKLKELPGTKYDATMLRTIRKDESAGEQFIGHRLNVFSVYCTLKARYGDDMQFFTKSQLAALDHFPKPLPDAYIQVGNDSNRIHFFLDILHEVQPFFLSTRKIIQYQEYARKGRWSTTQTKLPKILLICDSPAHEKRLTKHMRRVIASSKGRDAIFSTAVMGQDGSISTWRNMADADLSDRSEQSKTAPKL
jgi:DNA-binding MarR family transcriptional regulator